MSQTGAGDAASGARISRDRARRPRAPAPRLSTLGIRIRSGRLGHDRVQVLEPERELVDPHHPLGAAEVDRAERVAHEEPRGVLLGGVHRVLEVEDDAVGLVQAGVDHELGLVAREVEPRAAAAGPRRRGGSGAAAAGAGVALRSPTPARRTAASRRAAMTNGSAPWSSISTRACSTPSALQHCRDLRRGSRRRSMTSTLDRRSSSIAARVPRRRRPRRGPSGRRRPAVPPRRVRGRGCRRHRLPPRPAVRAGLRRPRALRCARIASVICVVVAAPCSNDVGAARRGAACRRCAPSPRAPPPPPPRAPASPSSVSPTWSSSIAAERIMAIGFTIGGSSFSYLGAEPWVGSNTATSSPMLPEQAKPRPPTRPANASETMSPNRLLATMHAVVLGVLGEPHHLRVDVGGPERDARGTPSGPPSPPPRSSRRSRAGRSASRRPSPTCSRASARTERGARRSAGAAARVMMRSRDRQVGARDRARTA